MTRRIPYGVGNYEEIVDGNYYYVDKTKYIRVLEQVKNPIFLRPRRFGKTLWCSTLQCYYDVNRKDRFEHLFGRTAIGKDPTPERNRYLVLRFNFSTMSVGDTIAELASSFDENVRNAVIRFAAHYANIVDFSLATVENISATERMERLLTVVSAQKTPPVYVIIDEYDNFTNQLITSRRDTDYYAVTGKDSFLKNFYKTLKDGVEAQTVGRIFITGVLPITVDDLTSGFNIARMIGLEREFVSMLGFTQSEAQIYLDEICAENGWDAAFRDFLLRELKDLYDSYRFSPDIPEPIYNATACNFYLDDLVRHDGELPQFTIDANLRTDVNWLARLLDANPSSRASFDELVETGSIWFDGTAMASRFNARQFFEADNFLTALYYLGLVTYGADSFEMRVPNATVKSIMLGYYTDLEKMKVFLQEDLKVLVLAVRSFFKTEDWASIYAAFTEVSVAKIPAQAYDKANENLFRTMFYTLCSHYLQGHYRVAIESNLPSGRADFVAVPHPGSSHRTVTVIEFKYFKNAEAEKLGVLNWTEPPAETKEQIDRYVADLQAIYPDYKMESHIVCIAGSKGYRFW